MKLLIKHITIFIFIGGIFFSCGKDSSCIKNTGKQTTEYRSINTVITKIKIEDNINLIITQNNIPELKLEGGANLLPYIHTRLNGNTLEISNGNKCNFLRSYKPKLTAYLSIPNLTEINYTGKGNVISEGVLNFPDFIVETRDGTGSVNLNLNSNNLSILSHTGATDFTITGTTNYLYAFSGSNSWFHMKNLAANQVQVNSDGTGDISVSPNNNFLVELTSLGNVIYIGNPTLTISVNTGSGKIIKQ